MPPRSRARERSRRRCPPGSRTTPRASLVRKTSRNRSFSAGQRVRSICGRELVGGKTHAHEKLGVELGLDRADRDEAAVGGLVHVVEVRTGVEHVGAAFLAPPARLLRRVEDRHQRGGTVDHGGVDDLPLARPHALEQRADHAEREQQTAATEIAHEIQRRRRRLAAPADRIERARERDVVDVVTGGLRERPRLPEAGHAAVDEPRVPIEADVRARGRGAPSRRGGSPRAGRRRARPGAAPSRLPRGSSGRRRCSAGSREADRPTRRPEPCARAARLAAPRRPCRRASSRRTDPGRCPRSRRCAFPRAVPFAASIRAVSVRWQTKLRRRSRSDATHCIADVREHRHSAKEERVSRAAGCLTRIRPRRSSHRARRAVSGPSGAHACATSPGLGSDDPSARTVVRRYSIERVDIAPKTCDDPSLAQLRHADSRRGSSGSVEASDSRRSADLRHFGVRAGAVHARVRARREHRRGPRGGLLRRHPGHRRGLLCRGEDRLGTASLLGALVPSRHRRQRGSAVRGGSRP